MKPKDLEETEEKEVILGTFMMASEGFDCKYPLDSIVSSMKSGVIAEKGWFSGLIFHCIPSDYLSG